jgi:hypothetical protein
MPYDMVLIDMQMPQTDGLTLGEQIKANPAFADIPLIMLTSTNRRDEVQQANAIGFAAYLVKPVKPSRLLYSIMNVLDTQRFESTNQPLASPASSHQPLRPNSSSKLRILLAEDNLVNQKVALKQLNSLGYDADVAANGQEVLQLLEKIPYDLILMDCQMPILDGFETTREIHSWHESTFASGRRPKIMAMTANAMKEDRQMCLDAGMDDYLAKPVSKAKLAIMLERWSHELLVTKEVVLPQTQQVSTADTTPKLEIDWEQLHQLSEGDAEFELEILQTFVTDTQMHLVALKIAIATHDLQQIQYKAHQIKGASANIGAKHMQMNAEKLEKLAGDCQLEAANKLISNLEEFINDICNYLNKK